MAYKISNTAMIIESDGKAILIADEAYYKGTLSIGSTLQDLPSDYFTDYFPDAAFQGTTSGYNSGGQGAPPYPTSVLNVIDKFPFSSDANATDVGDLSAVRDGVIAGQSSVDNGYTSGGKTQGAGPPYGTALNTIDKFPFSSDGNASDIADLSVARSQGAGHSSIAVGKGYTSGGLTQPPPSSDVIDKFPFSSDANATDVGNLTIHAFGHGGHSSTTDGYTAGGTTVGAPYGRSNVIDNFPFASNANATDVGDLLGNTLQCTSSQSSTTHGYVCGGQDFATFADVIQKFSFSSNGNATDVGDLTQGRSFAGGQTSTASGYASGGQTPPSLVKTNVVDKFPFSSDANATDVGDITVARNFSAGQQV